MNFKFLFKTLLIISIIGFIVSCDKDVNEIGADILQNNNHFETKTADFPVIAYNQKTNAVQSNNLPINSLGFYINDVFGSTTANFVTQLSIGTRPVFYRAQNDVVVDSVILYVPYFTKNAVTDATSGDTTFDLDSIQGTVGNKIKLEVYKSNYFIGGEDPSTGFTQLKKFYTDQNNDFLTNLDSYGRLNNDPKNIRGNLLDNSQNDQFTFSNSQIKQYATTDVAVGPVLKSRLAPGMYLKLDINFFRQNIIQANLNNLENDNTFQSYFSGLYFKVTSLGANAMSRINFKQGKVTMFYKDNTSSTDITEVQKTLTLSMSGNSVNFLDNVENPAYTSGVATPDITNGDSKLYLKGGNGSQSIIKLFNGDATSSATDLNTMRTQGWLINDAYLTFFIDNVTMGTEQEPNRLYLYDYNNKVPLLDYFTDGTSNANAKYNKLIFGGLIEKNTSGRGIQYKIRITNHIRNLIKYGGSNNPATNLKDSTNVKLGLIVTESINSSAFRASFKNVLSTTPLIDRYLPVMSIVNPLGTVLWGSNPSVPVAKRLKLQVYYTKPN